MRVSAWVSARTSVQREALHLFDRLFRNMSRLRTCFFDAMANPAGSPDRRCAGIQSPDDGDIRAAGSQSSEHWDGTVTTNRISRVAAVREAQTSGAVFRY